MIAVLLAFSWAARAEAEVTVRVPPVRAQESTTTRKSTTTIIGPRGKRVVRDDETGRTLELPGTVTTDEEERVDVRGVADPGIKVERKVYQYGQKPQPVETLVIEGGPGSVHRKATTRKRTLPSVEVRVK